MHVFLHPLTGTQTGDTKADDSKGDDGNESDSSTVSTTSSSGVNTDGDPTRNWERFDEEEEENSPAYVMSRPPLPPPRSALDIVAPAPQPTLNNPFQECDAESDDKNTPADRPFQDFSSSIAQTLFDNSQRLTGDDPYAASTLANTSKDLFKTIDEDEEKESGTSTPNEGVLVNADPLVPTTSSAAVVTSNDTTTIVRGSQLQNHRGGSFHVSASSPDFLHTSDIPLQPVVLQNPSANAFYTGPYSNSRPNFPIVRRPAGPRSPKFAQLDQFSQQQQEQIVTNSSPPTWTQNHTSSQPPPLKPAPYTGGALSTYRSRQHPVQDRDQLQALYSDSPLQSQNHNNNSSVCDGILSQQLQLNGVYNATSERERQDTLTRLMLQRLPSLGEFDPLKDFFKDDSMS